MDWKTCCERRIVKEIKEDTNKISAMKKIAMEKYEGANTLPYKYYYASITLLYDTLRTFLECLALQEGYKIYNHECYVSFLREVVHDSAIAEEFDKFRIIRNGINYYGREMSPDEGKAVIEEIKSLITRIKRAYFD